MRLGVWLSLMLLAPAAQAGEGCKVQALGWSKDNRLFAYEAQRLYGQGPQERALVRVGVVVNAYTNHSDSFVLDAGGASGARLKALGLQDPNPGAFAPWKSQGAEAAPAVRGRVARATVRLGNGTGAWKGDAFEFSGQEGHALEVTPTVVAGDGQAAVETWTLKPAAGPGAQQAVEGDLRAFFSPDGARVAWLLCTHGDASTPPEDSMRIGAAVPLEDAPEGPDKCNTLLPQSFPVIGKALVAAAKLRSQLRDPHANFVSTVDQAEALRAQFSRSAENGTENVTEVACASDAPAALQACLDPLEPVCEAGNYRVNWGLWADVPKSAEEAQALAAADAVLDGPRDLFQNCCSGRTCQAGGVAVPSSWIDAERLTAQVHLAANDSKFGNIMLETWKRSAKGLQKATCSCDTHGKKELAVYATRLDDATKTLPAGAHKQALAALLSGMAKDLRRGLPKAHCAAGG